MQADLIYFDNAATSWPKPPSVAESMTEFLACCGGNPGRGGHTLATRAVERVEETREALKDLVNAERACRIVMTHGCTDAVNQAIHGTLRGAAVWMSGVKPHVVVTAIEHNAVLRTAHCYESSGDIDLTVVNCDGEGRISAEDVESACCERTVLVSVSHASNACGTVQDVGSISRAIRRAAPEALFMVDAAQTAGHVAIDVQGDGIDLLAIAGHKGLRGPTGTGGLYVGPRAYEDGDGPKKVFCLRRGGTGSKSSGLEMPCNLPDALEAGTANAVGLAGLLAGMRSIGRDDHALEMRYAGMILDGLRGIDRVKIQGVDGLEGRTPVVLFSMDEAHPRAIAESLDRDHGICVRGGTHCAPLLHEAFGNGEAGAVRASPSVFTTEHEIDQLLGRIEALSRGGVLEYAGA